LKKLLLLACLALAPSCALFYPRPAVIVEQFSDGFDQALFVRCVEGLAQNAPVNGSVHIRLCIIEGPYLGLTRKAQDGYDVQIEARQSMSGILDTLIHEWAHCMVWGASQINSHDDIWGVAFSTAYRATLPFRGAQPVVEPPPEMIPPPTGPSTN
jgi:hypothetical protein